VIAAIVVAGTGFPAPAQARPLPDRVQEIEQIKAMLEKRKQ
jgi:hypothetical protein